MGGEFYFAATLLLAWAANETAKATTRPAWRRVLVKDALMLGSH
jgi:hypothetical protein